MGDFVRALIEVVTFLWPFRKVQQWEKAGFYRFGRFRKVLEPGVYMLVPWFMEVREISVVPAIVKTGRQDITLSDGSTLYFSATVTMRVEDLNLAVNSVDNYTETMQELVSSVLAEKLAEVDASRLAPQKRGRLLSDLARWVKQEAAVFGIEATKLTFTDFVLNAKTIRLLQGGDAPSTW